MQVTATRHPHPGGHRPDGRFPSGLFARPTGTGAGAGNAESVVVEAPRVILTEGARIGCEHLWLGAGRHRTGHRDRYPHSGRHLPRWPLPKWPFCSGSEEQAKCGGGRQRGRRSATGEPSRPGARIGSSTFGLGQGGTVQVTATDTLTLAGTSMDGRSPSGIFATAQGTGRRGMLGR